MNNDVWLVIPVYNEGQAVGDVVRSAREVFPHIVCIDDGSHDDSAQVCREAGALVIQHPINLGQGAALQTGFDYLLTQTDAEIAVTFDSDGQHRLEDAQAMVERLRSDNLDVVLGSRFLGEKVEAGFFKRILLRLATVFERLSTGMKVTDAHNGLRALNRHALSQLHLYQNRFAHASELLREISEKKLRWAEHPVRIIYTDYSRAKGQSMWNAVNIIYELFLG